MGPFGNSANTTASAALFGSRPMAKPPSLRKSFGVRSAIFPAPITTRRATFSPSGTASSSDLPLLPAKRSALAALATRPAADPSALVVAGPNLSPSSQNTMRTPVAPTLAGAEKGPKPSFRASVIGRDPYQGDFKARPIWRGHTPSAKPQIDRF